MPEKERNRLLEDVHTARHDPPWARDFIEVMCLDDKGAWM